MSVILIDCRNIGKALRYARSKNHLSLTDLANLLRVSKTDVRMFERGTKVISDAVLMRIMLHGIILLNVESASRNKKVKK